MAQHIVCPWWLGYLLLAPVRRLAQKPEEIVAPYVREGMSVLEPGPGMGYFTLELARRVGSSGRVIAIDIQPKMLQSLAGRARKVGLAERLVLRQPQGSSMNVADLVGNMDLVFAFAVVHELPDPKLFFHEMSAALKPSGKFLLAEPTGHVKPPDWEKTLQLARDAGLRVEASPVIRRMLSAVLVKG
jgi:ubiquinone/menaquinone biosynthesis C-methylase UbiE